MTNLRIHFKKEEGSDEILDDFEMRISELFNEKIRLGYGVITIVHVEEVIKRMGKPEDLFGEEFEKETSQTESKQSVSPGGEKINKRLFRNPDDRILGGVLGGMAAYMGWDPTILRLAVAFFCLVSFPWGGIGGSVTLIYLVLWLIVPVAYTATEKLQMRGESVTIENIGKTVTNSFEKVSNNVNDYINSGRPRTTLQKIADTLVDILGAFMKVTLVLIAVCLFPALLVGTLVLLIVLFALVFGGGFRLLDRLFPMVHWDTLSIFPETSLFLGSICALILVGMPLVAAIYAICSYAFKFKPVSSGVKVTLLIIWIVAFIVNIILAYKLGVPAWQTGIPGLGSFGSW